jgi:excisionase family DNA binding protein
LVNQPATRKAQSIDGFNNGGEAMTELRKPPVSEKGMVPIFGPGAAPLMDSNQAARFLGVHPRTLQRMVLRGQIAGVRVGKLWRFVPSAIQDWIAEHNIAS